MFSNRISSQTDKDFEVNFKSQKHFSKEIPKPAINWSGVFAVWLVVRLSYAIKWIKRTTGIKMSFGWFIVEPERKKDSTYRGLYPASSWTQVFAYSISGKLRHIKLSPELSKQWDDYRQIRGIKGAISWHEGEEAAIKKILKLEGSEISGSTINKIECKDCGRIMTPFDHFTTGIKHHGANFVRHYLTNGPIVAVNAPALNIECSHCGGIIPSSLREYDCKDYSCKDSCFGCSNLIQVRRRTNSKMKVVKVKDLQIGDEVLVSSNKWTTVWFINDHQGLANMLKITYETNNNIKCVSDHIILTVDHLIFASIDKNPKNMKLVCAGELFAHSPEYLYVWVYGKYPASVINVKEVLDKARSPISMDGNLIVGDVLVSSYTKSIENAIRLHRGSEIFKFIFCYLNESLAVMLTHFYYNIIYRQLLRKNGMEKLVYNRLFVPIVVIVPSMLFSFLVLFTKCV